MKSIHGFLSDDNEMIEVGKYRIPRRIVKEGKKAVIEYIAKVKKKDILKRYSDGS